MDGTGEWIYEEAKIKDIQHEFSKLYSSELCMAHIHSPVMNFSCCMLSEEERCKMGREVDEEEIRAALWSLKPFKAPGPDGLHARFFQYFWHDVQAFVCHEVKKAFAHVISKVLVARIRPLLNNLISPIQTAFVLRRRGVDNVVIAQELIYTMDRMKGQEGYMAVKVDLEKAYDRLEWSFIHKVLQAF
ncbi:hypothetical protein SO802_000794 [Lithocarpus litseifolius]|uniref:Reverse transcriptase domain-containing protein n=1 Tax=Lithocarpus litseifolius TaxID=425828 RepID=A0AAW2DSH5_9ROSI